MVVKTADPTAVNMCNMENVANQDQPISDSDTLIINMSSFCRSSFSRVMYRMIAATGYKRPRVINSGANSEDRRTKLDGLASNVSSSKTQTSNDSLTSNGSIKAIPLITSCRKW